MGFLEVRLQKCIIHLKGAYSFEYTSTFLINDLFNCYNLFSDLKAGWFYLKLSLVVENFDMSI